MLIAEMGEAVEACVAAGEEAADFWIRRYKPPASMSQNQFVVILKPELTEGRRQPAEVALARVLEVLTAHGVHFGAMRVMSSGFLAHQRLIEQQYGVLFRVSNQGLAAVSAAARKRLTEAFPFAEAAPEHVLGGHQFLSANAELSPFALDLLTRNVAVVKLGSGTYGIEVFLDGERFVVLNPFHPLQYEHFMAPGKAVVVLEGTSTRSLAEIRRVVIGATDPRDAVPGSLKRVLLDEESSLGLVSICTRRNGVHMSPGAIEGMVGVRRYFGTSDAEVSVEQTAFGAALLADGFSPREVAELEADPEVDVGRWHGPLFEVTEDMNWDEALVVARNLRETVSR